MNPFTKTAVAIAALCFWSTIATGQPLPICGSEGSAAALGVHIESGRPLSATINLKLPEGTASDDTSPEARKAVIETIANFRRDLTAAQALDSRDSPRQPSRENFDVKVTSEYTFIPAVDAELTQKGIETLARGEVRDRILCIEMAKIERTQLDESVPLIDADALGPSRGSGQIVVVIDNGVAGKHLFLSSRLLREACFRLDNGCPNGKNAQVNEAGAAESARTHGTHVAGIATGAATKVSWGTISGVASGAQLIAINVFTDTGADTRDQRKALEYVIRLVQEEKLPIASINMSLGGGAYSTACDASEVSRSALFKQLIALGVAPVVAAGNDGNSDKVSAPGCIRDAVTVSSVDKEDALTTRYNRSSLTDVLAPGVYIRSSVPNGKYDRLSGTSMAAPHVAGAFAVIKAALLNDSKTVSVAEVLEAIQTSGTVVEDHATGAIYKRLDTDDAIKRLRAAKLKNANRPDDKPPEGVLTEGPNVGDTVIAHDGREIAVVADVLPSGAGRSTLGATCRLRVGIIGGKESHVVIPCLGLKRIGGANKAISSLSENTLHEIAALQN